ncbi:MAG: hypothetical protein M3362_23680 [Acidobacteriota bacterium]|nr:hypothetical protein [Acidobacteriota bacterium]
MPTSPKDNEQRIRRILTAWETLAPEKTFGGMTLAQFKAAVQPSFDARRTLESLEDQSKQAIADCEAADGVSLKKSQQVVNGVRADPDFGPDSALYESFGYIPDRDRASGLTHKGSKNKPTE